MEKEVVFTMEEDVYNMFHMALNLTKEDEGKAMETCLKWYIAKTFDKVSKEYGPEKEKYKRIKSERNFYAKAKKRIPLWAKKPEQYCHKIIRGFFWCQEQYGEVSLADLEEICSKEEVPELYVPTFKNNYYQMKIDAAKTYGKVFEDDGDMVNIWQEVYEVLQEYKKFFCD